MRALWVRPEVSMGRAVQEMPSRQQWVEMEALNMGVQGGGDGAEGKGGSASCSHESEIMVHLDVKALFQV